MTVDPRETPHANKAIIPRNNRGQIASLSFSLRRRRFFAHISNGGNSIRARIYSMGKLSEVQLSALRRSWVKTLLGVN